MTRFRKILTAVLSVSLAGIPTLTPSASADTAPVIYDIIQSPRTVDQLKELVAPIALYSDAVLAQVLVAATYPDDVIAADRYLATGGDPNLIDNQSWDLSVKGIARFPDTLNSMANHPAWMNDLGDAFLNQQADVMSAVQLLRVQAKTAGNLVSNQYQDVIADEGIIEIVPANPDVVYLPTYDPQVVYVESVRPRYVPCETFGLGVAVGLWLHHDCDWHDRTIYVGSWGAHRPWWHHDGFRDRDHREFTHHYSDFRPGNFHSTRVDHANVTNVRNVKNVTNVQPTRWQRDDRKPAPKPTANRTRTEVRPTINKVNNSRTISPQRTPEARPNTNSTPPKIAAPQPNRAAQPQPQRESRATPAVIPHAQPAPAKTQTVAPHPQPQVKTQTPAPRPAPQVKAQPAAPRPAARPTPAARPQPIRAAAQPHRGK